MPTMRNTSSISSTSMSLPANTRFPPSIVDEFEHRIGAYCFGTARVIRHLHVTNAEAAKALRKPTAKWFAIDEIDLDLELQDEEYRGLLIEIPEFCINLLQEVLEQKRIESGRKVAAEDAAAARSGFDAW